LESFLGSEVLVLVWVDDSGHSPECSGPSVLLDVKAIKRKKTMLSLQKFFKTIFRDINDIIDDFIEEIVAKVSLLSCVFDDIVEESFAFLHVSKFILFSCVLFLYLFYIFKVFFLSESLILIVFSFLEKFLLHFFELHLFLVVNTSVVVFSVFSFTSLTSFAPLFYSIIVENL
jgi:hypothetical protein